MLSTLRGILIAFASNGALPYAGYAISASAYRGSRPLVRCVALGVSSVSLLVFTSLVLLFAGLFNLPGILVASVLVASLGFWISRRSGSEEREPEPLRAALP